MTGVLLALPATPFGALAGLPAPSELPGLRARRRFAQILACALSGEPAWQLETWPLDTLSPVLERRALQEDWPLINSGDAAVLLRPPPLPADVSDLLAPLASRPALEAVVRTLWQGEWPTVDAATNEAIGEAIRRAARAGSEAAETALREAWLRSVG